jgi:hydrogenase assembly chaperone HypC/HupF
MCLADLGPVIAVSADGGWAQVDLAGTARRVSLAPLVLDGTPVAVGDWVVVHTGLAVDLMDDEAATRVVAARRMVAGSPAMREEDHG